MSQGFTRKSNTLDENIWGSLGTAVAKSNDTVYHADQDGYVVAWGNSYGAVIYFGTSISDFTAIAAYHYTGGTGYAAACAPIKKGYYWKVTAFAYVNWVPFLY